LLFVVRQNAAHARHLGESNEILAAPSLWSVRSWRACRALLGKSRPASTVAAFGVKTREIIEAEPDRMREVSGIGEFRAERLSPAGPKRRPCAIS
jgi:hypothetical protein